MTRGHVPRLPPDRTTSVCVCVCFATRGLALAARCWWMMLALLYGWRVECYVCRTYSVAKPPKAARPASSRWLQLYEMHLHSYLSVTRRVMSTAAPTSTRRDAS
eukprot:COSAG06_NODE_2060_length_7699_cov_21.717105_4_plen_104_part_00